MVITSHSQLGKPYLTLRETKAHEGEVALPSYIEQVAKAGGDRWHGLEEEACVSPRAMGKALPSPFLCPHQGRDWNQMLPQQMGFCKGRGPEGRMSPDCKPLTKENCFGP